MSALSNAIQELYEGMSAQEASFAADSLVSLFKTLQGVERRLAHEKRSEQNNEDLRSTG